jgi:hypothetical protein
VANFAQRLRREREAKQRRKKRSPRQQATLEIVRGLLLAVLVFLGILLLLTLGVILALVIQAGTFNGIPSAILTATSFPDWHLIVSEGLVDSTIGVTIGYVLWRKLGQRKQNTIAEAEAMLKYDSLRIVDREQAQYIIYLTDNQGYKIPVWARGLAEHGIIQQADPKKTANVIWNEREPTKKELGLS